MNEHTGCHAFFIGFSVNSEKYKRRAKKGVKKRVKVHRRSTSPGRSRLALDRIRRVHLLFLNLEKEKENS